MIEVEIGARFAEASIVAAIAIAIGIAWSG
jgi:hypothetical protein